MSLAPSSSLPPPAVRNLPPNVQQPKYVETLPTTTLDAATGDTTWHGGLTLVQVNTHISSPSFPYRPPPAASPLASTNSTHHVSQNQTAGTTTTPHDFGTLNPSLKHPPPTEVGGSTLPTPSMVKRVNKVAKIPTSIIARGELSLVPPNGTPSHSAACYEPHSINNRKVNRMEVLINELSMEALRAPPDLTLAFPGRRMKGLGQGQVLRMLYTEGGGKQAVIRTVDSDMTGAAYRNHGAAVGAAALGGNGVAGAAASAAGVSEAACIDNTNGTEITKHASPSIDSSSTANHPPPPAVSPSNPLPLSLHPLPEQPTNCASPLARQIIADSLYPSSPHDNSLDLSQTPAGITGWAHGDSGGSGSGGGRFVIPRLGGADNQESWFEELMSGKIKVGDPKTIATAAAERRRAELRARSREASGDFDGEEEDGGSGGEEGSGGESSAFIVGDETELEDPPKRSKLLGNVGRKAIRAEKEERRAKKVRDPRKDLVRRWRFEKQRVKFAIEKWKERIRQRYDEEDRERLERVVRNNKAREDRGEGGGLDGWKAGGREKCVGRMGRTQDGVNKTANTCVIPYSPLPPVPAIHNHSPGSPVHSSPSRPPHVPQTPDVCPGPSGPRRTFQLLSVLDSLRPVSPFALPQSLFRPLWSSCPSCYITPHPTLPASAAAWNNEGEPWYNPIEDDPDPSPTSFDGVGEEEAVGETAENGTKRREKYKREKNLCEELEEVFPRDVLQLVGEEKLGIRLRGGRFKTKSQLVEHLVRHWEVDTVQVFDHWKHHVKRKAAEIRNYYDIQQEQSAERQPQYIEKPQTLRPCPSRPFSPPFPSSVTASCAGNG
eukprot:GHVQ01016845.1.p1 GENE.GHVQ01016845.1~~GHVQ01016845.1.p1  ORF type:complete len:937 (-),score=187.77 GHVQ01016845.1:2686-5181(-)